MSVFRCRNRSFLDLERFIFIIEPKIVQCFEILYFSPLKRQFHSFSFDVFFFNELTKYLQTINSQYGDDYVCICFTKFQRFVVLLLLSSVVLFCLLGSPKKSAFALRSTKRLNSQAWNSDRMSVLFLTRAPKLCYKLTLWIRGTHTETLIHVWRKNQIFSLLMYRYWTSIAKVNSKQYMHRFWF